MEHTRHSFWDWILGLGTIGSAYYFLEIYVATLEGRGLPLPLWYGILSWCLVLVCTTGVGVTVRLLLQWGKRTACHLIWIATAAIVTGKLWLVFGDTAWFPAGVAAGIVLLLMLQQAKGKENRISVEASAIFLTCALLVSTDVTLKFGVLVSNQAPWILGPLVTIGGAVFLAFALPYLERAVRWSTLSGKWAGIGLGIGAVLAGGLWTLTAEPIPWHRTVDYRGPSLDHGILRDIETEALPNVILISIDTLRSDRTPPFYPASKLPNLAELKSDSVRLTSTLSESSATLPSHASLFTGLLPLQHGAVSRPNTQIYADVPLYSQWFRHLGYRTGAFTGGGWVSGQLGFARGFDRYWEQPFSQSGYNDFVPGALEMAAVLLQGTPYPFHVKITRKGAYPARNPFDQVRYFRTNLQKARTWIRQGRGENRPFFLFLHTYQVHDYQDEYPAAIQRLRKNHSDLLKKLRDPNRPPSRTPDLRKLEQFERRLLDIGPKEWKLSQSIAGLYRKYQALRKLYDYGVEAVDQQFGQFLRFLRRRGIYRDSIIVFLSDHGEGFLLDSGARAHGLGQLDEILVRVPLWVKLPANRLSGKTYPETIQLRDLFPILLHYLKVPDPLNNENPVKGALSRMTKNETLPGRTYTVGMIKSQKGMFPKLSVRNDQFKVVRNLGTGETKFASVKQDRFTEVPRKPSTIPKKHRRKLQNRLKELIRDYLSAPDPYRNREQKPDPNLIEELRGLGYFPD